MSIFKTDAITLGRTDYSDSSQIITFYTRDHGKIRTIAKGYKRLSRKCSSKAIDLLTHYQILFIKKEHTSLHTLTEAVLQNDYPILRNNLDNYYRVSCMAELVNEFTEENDPSKQLFDVFLDSLTGISRNTNAIIQLLTFETKMLKILGYLPELKRCVNCKNSIQQLPEVYFNAAEGGVLCKTCQSKFRNGINVPLGAILIAERLVDINLQKLGRVKIQLPICIEIEKMLRYYITAILNKELNSWQYLKGME